MLQRRRYCWINFGKEHCRLYLGHGVLSLFLDFRRPRIRATKRAVVTDAEAATTAAILRFTVLSMMTPATNDILLTGETPLELFQSTNSVEFKKLLTTFDWPVTINF